MRRERVGRSSRREPASGILTHAWEQTQQGGRNKGPIPRRYLPSNDGPPRRPVPDALD
jgi:citrate synthase